MFAYQHAHGLSIQRLLNHDVVIRHRCDEASCQNPAHLLLGTAADNTGDYRLRRYRVGGPLTDLRGTAGRAIAIRDAILNARARGPAATDAAITAAILAGDSSADQPALFDLPDDGRRLPRPTESARQTGQQDVPLSGPI